VTISISSRDWAAAPDFGHCKILAPEIHRCGSCRGLQSSMMCSKVFWCKGFRAGGARDPIAERREGSMMIGLMAIPKLAALLGGACAAMAQLAAPNEAGVSMGHVHLIVADSEAGKNFWVTLGGEASTFGPFAMIKFPGSLILIKQAEPSGPAAGSVVDHVCFQVPDLAKALAAWQAAGLKTEPGRIAEQAYVITPDELLRVEVTEVPSLNVPIAFHHVHFFVGAHGYGGENAVAEMQAWYAKNFGAKPGKRMQFDAADLPGANLTFSKSAVTTAGTVGRAIDHISFEVADLPAFCRKLEAGGLHFDVAYTERPDLGISFAFLTDPWGTKIECTQGVLNL
jgi:catechol 2,3-dioxygenase-like lactoylglutathione lyase family enzyme